MDISDDDERRRPIGGGAVRMDDDNRAATIARDRATRFLSIENLPGKMRPAHAREICGDFGVVKRAVVDVGALRPGTSEMKIVVEFESAEACARARDALDGASVEGSSARCDFARGLSTAGRASVMDRLELPRASARGARGHDFGAPRERHQALPSTRATMHGRDVHRDANGADAGRFGRKRARSSSPPRRDRRRDRSPPRNGRDDKLRSSIDRPRRGDSIERRRRSMSPRRGGRRRSPSPSRFGGARRGRSRSLSRSRSRSRDRAHRRSHKHHHRSRSSDRRRREHDRREDDSGDGGRDDDGRRSRRRADDDAPRRRRRDRSLSSPSRSSSDDDRSRSPPRRRRRRERSRSRSR